MGYNQNRYRPLDQINTTNAKTSLKYPAEAPRVACCGMLNRGLAMFDGNLFRITLQAHRIALDPADGKAL